MLKRVLVVYQLGFLRIKVSGGPGTQVGGRSVVTTRMSFGDLGPRIRDMNSGRVPEMYLEWGTIFRCASFMGKQLYLQRPSALSTAGYPLLRSRLRHEHAPLLLLRAWPVGVTGPFLILIPVRVPEGSEHSRPGE